MIKRDSPMSFEESSLQGTRLLLYRSPFSLTSHKVRLLCRLRVPCRLRFYGTLDSCTVSQFVPSTVHTPSDPFYVLTHRSKLHRERLSDSVSEATY